MTKSDNLFLGFFSLLLVIVLALMGCGGGSAGTGTGPVVVVQGAVLDESGAPVENVDVRVVETGNEDTTSENGEFEILTTPESENVTLEISSETGTAYITIQIPEEGGTVSVTLTVNPELSKVDATTLEMGAAIVGRCDIYFENRLTIRQSNRVPGGLKCVARVTVSAEDKKLAQIPIAIQYRDCDGINPWTTIAAGSTMGKPNLGVGQVRFPFIDDETHCVYRIVAPFGVPNLPELERTILTSTYQRRQ
jgi:hypothetical protein